MCLGINHCAVVAGSLAYLELARIEDALRQLHVSGMTMPVKARTATIIIRTFGSAGVMLVVTTNVSCSTSDLTGLCAASSLVFQGSAVS